MKLSVTASIVGAAFLTFVVCMCFIPDHDPKARHIDKGLATDQGLHSRKLKQLFKDAAIHNSPPVLVCRVFSTPTPTFKSLFHTDTSTIIVSCRAPPAYAEFQLPT